MVLVCLSQLNSSQGEAKFDELHLSSFTRDSYIFSSSLVGPQILTPAPSWHVTATTTRKDLLLVSEITMLTMKEQGSESCKQPLVYVVVYMQT